MRAHFGLPSVEAEDKEGKPPISVKFEIPYFTTSGIQVCARNSFPHSVTYHNYIQPYVVGCCLFYLTQEGAKPLAIISSLCHYKPTTVVKHILFAWVHLTKK